MLIKTNKGQERRPITRSFGASANVPSPAGKKFYYGGTLEDGVRTFIDNRSGTYIDGEDRGTFEWGFALVNGRPMIKSFRQWGEAYHTENDQPAVQIYMNFTTGKKAGESYTEVVGAPNGPSRGLFLSPIFATKE